VGLSPAQQRQYDSMRGVPRPTVAKWTWSDVRKKAAESGMRVLDDVSDSDKINNTNTPGIWRFSCSCGKIFLPALCNVVSGLTRSCGCKQRKLSSRTWQQVLEVCAKLGIKAVNPQPPEERVANVCVKGLYYFQCSCGKEFSTCLRNLLSGVTKSCGCLRLRAVSVKGRRTRPSRFNPEDVHNACAKVNFTLLDDLKEIRSGDVLVQCHCGSSFQTGVYNLLGGKVRSCGCIKSHAEADIARWLQSKGLDVVRNSRTAIAPFELDIYLPSLSLAIEHCGLHWHGERLLGKVARLKHVEKLELCREKNIRLITVFEDEWVFKRSAVESFLSNVLGFGGKPIGARACSLELEPPGSRSFMDVNHLQGPAGGVTYGLRYGKELVACSVFSRPNASRARKAALGEWELSRYCVGERPVKGGLERLLAAFRREHPDAVRLISYSDNRWSVGRLYERLGFIKETDGTPSYWYFKKCRPGPRIHRYRFRKKEALRIFGADPSLTEWQIMSANGYDRIWDCGSARWALDLKPQS